MNTKKPVKSVVRQSARVKKEEACEASLEGFSNALAFGSDSSVCNDGEGWFFGCIMMGLLHVSSAFGNLDSGPDKATSGLCSDWYRQLVQSTRNCPLCRCQKNKDLQGRDPSADSMAASGFLRFQKAMPSSRFHHFMTSTRPSL